MTPEVRPPSFKVIIAVDIYGFPNILAWEGKDSDFNQGVNICGTCAVEDLPLDGVPDIQGVWLLNVHRVNDGWLVIDTTLLENYHKHLEGMYQQPIPTAGDLSLSTTSPVLRAALNTLDAAVDTIEAMYEDKVVSDIHRTSYERSEDGTT